MRGSRQHNSQWTISKYKLSATSQPFLTDVDLPAMIISCLLFHNSQFFPTDIVMLSMGSIFGDPIVRFLLGALCMIGRPGGHSALIAHAESVTTPCGEKSLFPENQVHLQQCYEPLLASQHCNTLYQSPAAAPAKPWWPSNMNIQYVEGERECDAENCLLSPWMTRVIAKAALWLEVTFGVQDHKRHCPALLYTYTGTSTNTKMTFHITHCGH